MRESAGLRTAEVAGALTTELEPQVRKIGPFRRAGLLVRDNPLGVFGLAVVLILGVFALFAPLIAPFDPDKISAGPAQADPSGSHLFGTDKLGRDMFSRVVFGARISLLVGFSAAIFGTAAGTFLGILSGYVGGWLDNVIQRTVDTLIAFPALLLLLILRQVLGADLKTLILAVGLAIIPGVTRVVRGAVLSERNNQYVEAAKALGATTPRILLVHIAPNVVALAIIVMTTLLGTAILAEAALAFLGLGIADAVTWGGDVNAARRSFPFHFWWAFFPGAAITVTVLGFNLLGDSLRDILDPRLRGRL